MIPVIFQLVDDEHLAMLIAILDACQVDFEVDFDFQWDGRTEAGKRKSDVLRPFFNSDGFFDVSLVQKAHFLELIANRLSAADFCHYYIRANGKMIGIGYDHCSMNILNPAYFAVTDELLQRLGDSDVHWTDDVGE
jgi:hypothetical protein